MSLTRFKWDKNGDTQYKHWFFMCNRCALEIDEQDWHYESDGTYHLCSDCAFILGMFTEKEFLSSRGLNCGYNAAVVDGEIEIWTGRNKLPPSQRKKKDQRHTQTYSEWRNAVFQRDDYTCRLCGIRGNTLNAHHKKSFNDHPKLRYDIDNGITLCVGCHRELHRREKQK